MNTAELRQACLLSRAGTTEPRYLRTNSGCSRIASDIEQKMTPCFSSLPLKVVATETLSKIASTATPASASCSLSGIPSFS